MVARSRERPESRVEKNGGEESRGEKRKIAKSRMDKSVHGLGLSDYAFSFCDYAFYYAGIMPPEILAIMPKLCSSRAIMPKLCPLKTSSKFSKTTRGARRGVGPTSHCTLNDSYRHMAGRVGAMDLAYVLRKQ